MRDGSPLGPQEGFRSIRTDLSWIQRCGFWDGSNEWLEMSTEDRQLFLLPITIAGYIGAFLVIAGLYAYAVVAIRKPANWGDLIFFLTLALPIGFWFCSRSVQVIRSVHRYNRRVSSGLS